MGVMNSRQLVILFENENDTAANVGIYHINRPNIFVLVSYKPIKPYSFKVQILRDNASNDVCCKHAYPVFDIIAQNLMEEQSQMVARN